MGVVKSEFTEDPGITIPLPISNSGEFSIFGIILFHKVMLSH